MLSTKDFRTSQMQFAVRNLLGTLGLWQYELKEVSIFFMTIVYSCFHHILFTMKHGNFMLEQNSSLLSQVSIQISWQEHHAPSYIQVCPRQSGMPSFRELLHLQSQWKDFPTSAPGWSLGWWQMQFQWRWQKCILIFFVESDYWCTIYDRYLSPPFNSEMWRERS